jgi:hypothetical protein
LFWTKGVDVPAVPIPCPAAAFNSLLFCTKHCPQKDKKSPGTRALFAFLLTIRRENRD